jgi:hypothetical protein
MDFSNYSIDFAAQTHQQYGAIALSKITLYDYLNKATLALIKESEAGLFSISSLAAPSEVCPSLE